MISTYATEQISQELGIPDVRLGTPDDAVLGVEPHVVACPQEIEGVSRLLAWANERGLKVVPCGARTKLDRGAPPAACDILLALSALSGVVEHAAGDMTVTVRAGTRLADLQAALALAGQRLPIDPPVPGTVGGLIATGDSGPLRLRYGGVRDLLLGVTFLRADGVIAKGGGKVVKNVAGYDLPKLLTGSLGTLGVIVEATFRLYPLPATDALVIRDGVSPREASEAALAVLTSSLVPGALVYMAEAEHSALALRFEGSRRSVEAQARQAVEVLESATPGGSALVLPPEEGGMLWQRLGHIAETAEGDVLARLVAPRSELAQLLESASRQAGEKGVRLATRAHMGHGHALVRWYQPSAEDALALLGDLRTQAQARDSSLVIWRAPVDVRSQMNVWGNVGEGLELMRRIKAQFDPSSTLNPGRFAGGI